MNTKTISIFGGIVALLVAGYVALNNTSSSTNLPQQGSTGSTVDTTAADNARVAFEQYNSEEGFSFEYPSTWELRNEEAQNLPVEERVDLLKKSSEENGFTRSNIAVIMTDESPTTVESRIVNEFDGKRQSNEALGDVSGNLFLATRQATTHSEEAPESQLEYVTIINGQTFWLRLFSSPGDLEEDRETFTKVITSLAYNNQ